MSDANPEITTVEADANKNANGNGEAAKYRKRAGELKARVAELESKNVDLENANADLLKRLEDAPGEAAAKIAELEGKIRTRTHRDAFGRLAGDKIKNDALDDAYSLSGWQADADEVDEAKLTEAIDTLLASREYLRVETQSPVEESTSPVVERLFNLSGSRPVPVKGAGRGPAPSESTKQTAYSF